MKITYLFREFRPRMKCGAAIPVMAGSSIFGSLVQANSSENIASSQIAAQRQENMFNRAWQTVEAEKARSYNTAEREASQKFAVDMMNMQNSYNDPRAQAQRLENAGLNPVVSMSGNVQNVSASSQPSSPQTSPMPSGVQGLSPVSQQPLDLQIPQLLSSVGGYLKDTAEAKNKSVETDRMIKTLNDYIQQAHIDTRIKQLSSDMLEIDKFVKENVKDASVLKAWDESKKATADAILAGNEVSFYDIKKRIMESQEVLNKALAEYHGKNAELVGLDIGSYQRRVNGLLDMLGAQSEESRASAGEKKANTAVLESESRIRAVAANIQEKSSREQLVTLLSELKAKDALSQSQFKQALSELKKINKILETYRGNSAKLKVDAVLDNFFKIIGLNVSASVHN